MYQKVNKGHWLTWFIYFLGQVDSLIDVGIGWDRVCLFIFYYGQIMQKVVQLVSNKMLSWAPGFCYPLSSYLQYRWQMGPSSPVRHVYGLRIVSVRPINSISSAQHDTIFWPDWTEMSNPWAVLCTSRWFHFLIY